MKSAGAAQCQEESEHNPWFLHSAGVGGLTVLQEGRSHLFADPVSASPYDTFLSHLKTPPEKDIPLIPCPQCAGFQSERKGPELFPIRIFAYQKGNCSRCSSKDTLACRDGSKCGAFIQTYQSSFYRF